MLLLLPLAACGPSAEEQAAAQQEQAQAAAGTAVAAVFATLTAQPTAVPSATHTATPTSTPTASPTATPTATHTPTPEQSPTNTPTTTPAPPTAADIYRRLAPAVAYLEVLDGTGSGILLEGGYIVTNAHVVSPFRTARVVFPSGEEHLDVPVVNLDYLTDLAVLGPIETKLKPVKLTSGEALSVGAEVYLIGYPGEGETYPQPALSRGLISRMRQWPGAAITYFQSDAAVAGGQSGGMLVSPDGEVIGISGFAVAEGNFALVASAVDLQPRIDSLIAGRNLDDLASRDLFAIGDRVRQSYAPEPGHDQQAYLLNEPAGTTVTMRASADAGFRLLVESPNEGITFFEESEEGDEIRGEFTINYASPYFLVLEPLAEPWPDEIQVRATRRLAPFTDPDDGRALRPGELLAGQIDFGVDRDPYTLALEEGDVVTITVDSITVDPRLTLMVGEEPGIVEDDDSGGGVFGTNARLIFRAEESGVYDLIVEESTGWELGGYLLGAEIGQ